MNKVNRKEFFIVVGIIILLLAIGNLIIQKDIDIFGGGDKNYYYSMAEDPFSDNSMSKHAPFAYRVGFPIIVHSLNYLVNNLDFSFKLLTNLFLGLTMFLLYYYLRYIQRFNFKSVILGLIIFALIPYLFVFYLYDFYLVDSLLFLFIISFFILLESKFKFREIGLFVVITLGIFVKEYILLLLGLYYFYELRATKKRLFDSQIFLKTFKLGIFALLIFLFLRFFIPVSDSAAYFSSTLFGWSRLWTSLYDNFISRLYLSLSVLWVFVILSYKNLYDLIKERLDYLYIIVITFLLSLLVADLNRVIVYIFPIFIPLMILTYNEKIISKNILLFVLFFQTLLIIVRYFYSYSFSVNNLIFLYFEIIGVFIVFCSLLFFVIKKLDLKWFYV